jgi:hypothetical protein
LAEFARVDGLQEIMRLAGQYCFNRPVEDVNPMELPDPDTVLVKT